jgi:hypothetical protein
MAFIEVYRGLTTQGRRLVWKILRLTDDATGAAFVSILLIGFSLAHFVVCLGDMASQSSS